MKKKIILIFILLISFLSVTTFVGRKLVGSKESEVIESSEVLTTASETKESRYTYNTGYVDDGYYINDWANIKIEITEDFPNDTASSIKTLENEEKTTEDSTEKNESASEMLYELGFTSTSKIEETGSMFYLEFVSGVDGSNVTSQKCLEDSKDSFIEGFNEVSNGICSFNVSDVFKYELLNETYLAQEITIEKGEPCFFVLSLARELDGKVIFIAIFGIDQPAIQKTLNHLQAVHE